MLDRLIRLYRAIVVLTDGMAYLAVLALLGLTFLVTFEVIARYAFNSPTMWADEIASYFLLAIVFLGMAHTLRMGGHIRIEILTGLLSRRGRVAAELFAFALGIVFAALMIVASWSRLANFWERETHSYSILYTPLFIPAIPLLIGSIVFLLMMVMGLIAYATGREQAPHGRAEAELTDSQ